MAKKFYTVKETARLLGVSTNTVYKYVDTGVLSVRRLGRGRIKIPYTSLSSMVDISRPIDDLAGDKNRNFGAEPTKPTSSPSVETIKLGVNDIFFFRMFRGLTLLGLGLIYLIDGRALQSFGSALNGQTSGFLLTLMPFVLIFAGTISVLFDFQQKSSVQSRILVHIFNGLVFSFFILASWVSGMYGQIVFIAPLGVLAFTHIARGIFPGRKSNFYDEFLRYILLAALFGGGLVLSSSSFFPIPSLREIVELNKEIFAIIWFTVFIPPMIYFLSPYGRKSKWLILFFVIWIAFTLVTATKMTIYAKWDMAYMSYLTATFGIFFVLWFLLNQEIDFKKLYIFLYLFGWVGLSFIFGLGAIKTSQAQLLNVTRNEASYYLSQVETQMNDIFKNQKNVMVEYAGQKDLIENLNSGNRENLTSYAKYVFERTQPASRVLIYNADGIAVGVYPINSLTLGADFSSRDYFVITKATYKGYTTSVYKTVLGTDAILQSEPIFDSNKFVGMIGVAINLETLSKNFKPAVPESSKFFILDENNVVVYAADHALLGKQFKGEFLEIADDPLAVSVEGSANLPRWKSLELVPSAPVLDKVSNLNVNLTVLLLFNVLISLALGFVASSYRNEAAGLNKLGAFN